MEDRKVKAVKFRGFNKSNLLNWLILLERNGFVMCSFKNCNFMAFDIDGMADHYSRCNSDKSNIKFNCEYCSGGIDTEDNLLKHKVLHHPQHAQYKDFSDFNDKEHSLFPTSFADREVSYVMKRSWQVFLETKKYIKCLVQTCLYVANSIDQMANHHRNYCTPQYRDQLTFTCFTCQGRTDSLSDLKTHCSIAHPISKTETNKITPSIIHYWSELLHEFNWAKCFHPKCNFIECDISTLKVHYSTCTNPSKEGLVECSKCRGWLNGFTRLRKHIKMAHNPYNPRPIVYMVPVKLIEDKIVPVSEAEVKRALSSDPNSVLCEDLFYKTQIKTNLKITNGNEIIECPETNLNSSQLIQNKKPGGTPDSPKIFDCSEEDSISRINPIYNCDNENDSNLKIVNGNSDLSKSGPCDTSSKNVEPLKKFGAGKALARCGITSNSESDPDEPDEIDPNSNPNDNLSSPEQDDEMERDRDTVLSLSTSELEPPVRGDGLKTYTHTITANKKLPHFYPAFIPRTTFEIDCSKAQRNQVTFSKDIINTNEWKLELPHVTLRTRNTMRRKTVGVSKVVKSTLSRIAQEMIDRQGPLVPVAIKINEMDTSWTVHVPSLNMNKNFPPKLNIKTETEVSTKTNFKEAYWDNVEADMMELLKISVKNSSIRNNVRYHKHKTRSRVAIKDEDEEDSLFKHELVKEDELSDDPRKDLGLTSDVEADTDSDDLYIDEPVDLLPDEFFSHEPNASPPTKEQSSRGSWCVRLVEHPEVAESSKKSASNDSKTEYNKKGQSVDNDVEATEAEKNETSIISEPSASANNQTQTTTEPSNSGTTQLNDESPPGPSESGTNPGNKVDINDSQQDLIKDGLLGKQSESINADLKNQGKEYSKNKNKKPEENNSEPDQALDFSGVKTNQEGEVSTSSKNNEKEKVNGADLTSSCRQEVLNANPTFVCSDGIHCGTDDESVDSPPPAVDCDESIEHESNGENSKSASQSNPTSTSEEGAVSNQSQEAHQVVLKEEFDTPDLSEESSLVNHVEPSNVSLGSTGRAKGRKRKSSNPTHSENDVTPKVKHVRPSSSNLIISDKIDSISLSPAVTITPVGTSTKRKSGRPRKKSFNTASDTSEISELLWPISGGVSSTPNRKTGRKRTPKISPMANVSNQSFNLNFTPEGPSSMSSIGDSVIIPDQDFSTINQNSPVPSGIINMDEVVNQKQCKTRNRRSTELNPPQRKPKNKRSTDIMAALGDRITPSSPLSNPNKKVTCAVCSQSISALEYQSKHLREHNFLCWLTTEMPLPLEDFNTMVLVASRGKRAHPDHVFTCDKCERPSKSASGYLCHIRFCGKSKDEADSLMIVCDQCNRLFKPNCIDQHVRSAHSKSTLTPEQAASINSPSSTRLTAANTKKKISEIVGILLTQDDVEKSIKPNTPSKSEPSNRVITKKLLKSWKEADARGSPLFCPITNCDFRCNCFDTIQSHYRACNPLDPTQQVFMCKLCPYQTNFKEYYLGHMKEEHCLLVHLPENVAYYPIKFLKDLEDDMYCSFTWVRCTTVFKPCLQLTRELKDKYFSKESLFPDMLVGWENWTSLEDDNPAYQPNYHTSPAIRYNSTNEWLRLPCYSAASFKGESLLWTGGSVHSMAWCPSPPNVVTDQFLAISCLLNLNNVFTIGNTYVHPTTIQLWNYGSVLNSEWLESSADSAKTPSLSYALCINEGPVWDLEWCPSGCYDLRRIGLLACATASGAVNIYTLPHPNQLNIPTERCPLFKGVPTMRLLLSRNESFQCQKISWSKVKPHKLIAGGFVNGIVAIWDLSVTSTFLREGSVLYPCRLFQAHHSTVTCLKMCPVDSNFVVSGSLDKYIKLWDLRDVSNPVHSMVRGGITDLDWLVNWLGYSFGMDAGLTPSPSSVFFSSVRDFSFIPTPLIGHPTASVKSISGSDWLNCFATGYDDGNVILTSCLRQFGDGSEAKKKIAKFILRTELVDLSKGKIEGVKEDLSVPEDSSSYEDTINMFGISISTSKSIEDKGKMDTVEEPRNDVYPIHSVTKVCFNPNQPSFLTLAVGFESGFISTLQLLPSRQVFSDIQVLCSKNSPNLSEDYKF